MIILVAFCQYWRSLLDDAFRRDNGKLDEHRIATRCRQRVFFCFFKFIYFFKLLLLLFCFLQKLSHRLEMFDKADLPAEDKEKARGSLNMDNARDSMSSEESDADGGQRTYPIRFVNSLSFTDTDGGQTTFRAH